MITSPTIKELGDLKTWKRMLTKRKDSVSMVVRLKRVFGSKQKGSEMSNIKNIINRTPKFVSLAVLASGFIYAGWQLAGNVQAVKVGVVLLALFLVRELAK